MSRPLRIYVAGPYTSSDPAGLEENTLKAIDAGIAVLQKGHIPFIPHLTHYVDLRARMLGIELTWDDYIRWDMEWLDLCDALLFLGESKGANMELSRARQSGKEIYYSLWDVPETSDNPPSMASAGPKQRESGGRPSPARRR